MHARFLNEVTLDITLRPQTPLLIKSGEGARADIDPTLPDMFFVRTRQPGAREDTIYIPGSSFRGVVRSHAERLVRSLYPMRACDPTRHGREDGSQDSGYTIRSSCLARVEGLDKKTLRELWHLSCYTCRLFGNTGLSARVKVGDWYPEARPLTEVRYGVAIDRVTGAVAHGPFQLETVTDGAFKGRVVLRNFTLGQLGLMGASLLDIADGLIPLGHAKSRGLGRVTLAFDRVIFRFPVDPQQHLLGVGALADVPSDLRLPADDRYAVGVSARRERWYYEVEGAGDTARQWLESLASRWPGEVGEETGA